jgi:hypothetical protein
MDEVVEEVDDTKTNIRATRALEEVAPHSSIVLSPKNLK